MNRRTILKAAAAAFGYGQNEYGTDGYGGTVLGLPDDLPRSMDRVEVRYAGDGRIQALKVCEYDPDSSGNICTQYKPE